MLCAEIAQERFMREKITVLIRNLRIVATMLLLLVVPLLVYFLTTSPVAFQKSTAIKFVNKSELLLSEPKGYINIQEILQRIPYKDNGGMVYEISPKQKYKKTIKEGYGNCSNLAFGLAYYLDQNNHEYQIVHLMPPDGFLNGQGHTVVSTPYTIKDIKKYGIVDVYEGGLPQNNNEFVDVNNLRTGGFDNPLILSLNSKKDSNTPYYEDFLNKAIVGIIKSEEVKSYFNFIDYIYVPLGNKRIEKILYDGLSVVLGYYPNIYVLEDDFDTLLRENKANRILAITLLTSIRIFIVLSILLAVAQMLVVVNNRITKPR